MLRILRLAERVGALEGTSPTEPVHVEDGPAFVREAAVEGMVLLENRSVDGTPALPWDAAALGSVAVIGDNAANARTQGGGSATVLPAYTISPLAGLRAALPGAAITYSVGAVSQTGLADLPLDQLTNPVTGAPGARVRFVDESTASSSSPRTGSRPRRWSGSAATPRSASRRPSS